MCSCISERAFIVIHAQPYQFRFVGGQVCCLGCMPYVRLITMRNDLCAQLLKFIFNTEARL